MSPLKLMLLIMLLIGMSTGLNAKPVKNQSVASRAQTAFNLCFKRTEKDRNECEHGCGNILAACYAEQLSVISTDTQKLTELMKTCSESVNLVDESVANLENKFATINEFDGTWEGFDTKVETALFKNKVLRTLKTQCDLK